MLRQDQFNTCSQWFRFLFPPLPRLGKVSFSFISSFIFSFSILITCQSNSSVSGTLNVRHGGGGGGSRQENNRDEGGHGGNVNSSGRGAGGNGRDTMGDYSERDNEWKTDS